MNKIFKLILFISIIMIQITGICYASDGWTQINHKWYYFDNNGNKQTGWLKDSSGLWYYLSDSGEMLANATTPDGYHLDDSGAWISDAKKYWNIDFLENDIERIDLYNIPIPIAAKKKIITNKEDIFKLYTMIVNCKISDDEILPTSGGIYMIDFVKNNGEHILLKITLPYIYTNGTAYSISNADSFPYDAFWDTLNYEEISISENDIPTDFSNTSNYNN